jgi:hypothetical protein
MLLAVAASACGDSASTQESSCDACAASAVCSAANNFTCECPSGTTGDGTTAGTGCTDIDECTANTDDCDPNAACTDSDGTFTCACNSGFAGDGHTGGTGCTDIDECTAGTDHCDDILATCIDSDGGYTCDCAVGYDGDGLTTGTGCTNIDECTTGTDDCVDTLATCADTDGSFTCTCIDGSAGDGIATGTGCADIDECALDSDNCDLAECINSVGAFSCRGIYGTSPFQGAIFRVDPLTLTNVEAFSPDLAGFTITGITALTQDPTDGTYYAVLKVSGVSGRVLATINILTGDCTQIGNLGDNFSSIAFKTDGQLFGTTGNGASVPETLFLIDKTNGTTTLAAALGAGVDGEVIAYNPDDDFFYHWSGNGTVVFERVMSVAPYTATDIPIVGTPNGETFGALWRPNGVLGGEFLISNISSSFNVILPDGTWGPQVGSTLDDLRGLVYGPTVMHRVVPATGDVAGGETVRLLGQGFTRNPPADVIFGGTTVAVTVIDDNTLELVTPAGSAAGPIDISTMRPWGTVAWNGQFSYTTSTLAREVEPSSSAEVGAGCNAGLGGSAGGALLLLGAGLGLGRRRRRR